MMMMRWYDEQTYEYDGSRMSLTEYNLKAIMYSVQYKWKLNNPATHITTQ